MDLFLHNVYGINGSVPMNNAFFSIDMKAYQSDIFNMQIESCDSLLQWLSFAFRIKSKLFTTIALKKKLKKKFVEEYSKKK